MSKRYQCALAAGAAVPLLAATASASVVTNGSFETGDFTAWVVTDIPVAFQPAAVLPSGTVTAFDGFQGPNVVLPSDGAFAATHGFDGTDATGTTGGTISIAQDIGVAAAGEILAFDFRAGWDLLNFAPPGASDRLFEVLIEPAGGGAALGTFTQLTATVGTTTGGGPNSDTGPLSGMIDLTAFAGTDIRANFLWTVPDAATGPANAQLDNVRIIPAPGALALAALGGLAGLRRRR